MGPFSRVAAALFLGIASLTPGLSAQTTPDDGIATLIARLEQAVLSGDMATYLSLFSSRSDRGPGPDFADIALDTGVTRAVVRERDRVPLQDVPGGYRLVIEVFTERGPKGRIGTWRLDIEKNAAGEWRIRDQERLTAVEGLYRLALDQNKQFQVRDLVVTGEDLTLTISSGTAFVAEADGRPTVLVLRGRGEMIFSPAPASERTQMKIFAGAETLRTDFDTAFLRINPGEFDARVSSASLTPTPVDRRELERATEIFQQFVGKSFSLDLSDLSRDAWSLSPGGGDFLAEVRTRRFKTLTYARSSGEAEDVTLFDRARKRNIALYPSAQKLSMRGRFYNEDDRVEYDVLDQQIEASFDPAREWVEGRTRLTVKVRTYALATFTIRLAGNLTVRSIVSDRFGRLLGLRVRGQDSIIINLPSALPKDTVITLVIAYVGRIAQQSVDREAMGQPQDAPTSELPPIPAEPRYLYSNRSYWYPQSTVSDYATATLRLTVPSDFSVVASGEPAVGSPELLPSSGQSLPLRRYTFVASQPVRYLSCVISRFMRFQASPVARKTPAAGPETRGSDGGGDSPAEQASVRSGVFYDSLSLAVEANPRQQARSRVFSSRAAEILEFFTTLVADFPYQSFTLALVEDHVPGGHSPAYFALLNQPLPTSPFVWRSDPVNFDGYPDFFLAHELAHQWWGQAVGWKNYHEQWLSEGLAQYFAALYAQENLGERVFNGIIGQMRRSAIANSAQGPVYLGYRLGHLQGDGRIFRALVYNKSAAVLHMLRALVGDDAFFRGLRRFYDESRFQKAGTEELRAAFEAEGGRPLERFFERWIYGAGIPTLTFSYRVEPAAPAAGESPQQVVLRFEQGEEIYDVPVTVSLISSTGAAMRVVVPVTDKVTEKRVPFAGKLRSVEVNSDQAALAEFRR